MNQLTKSLEEVTAEALVIYGRMEKDYHRLGQLLLEAKELVPHGKWMPYLEEHFPLIGQRQANRYMELAKDPTKTLNDVTWRQPKIKLDSESNLIQPCVAPVTLSREEPLPNRRDPRAVAFNREVDKLKKENEAVFYNRANFMLHRIREAIHDDAPGKGFVELEKLNPALLSPADMDLVHQLIEECGKLAIRAANWHTKLKEKFRG